MSITAPKKIIIHAIISSIPEEEIRQYFNISTSASIDTRLENQDKTTLINFLRLSPHGNKLVQGLEQRYPLDSIHTFFLPKISISSISSSLLYDLSNVGNHNKPLVLGQSTNIRSVYINENPISYEKQGLLEIPIVYEQKIEYRVADQQQENYGEKAFLYSLEQGLIWILDNHSHAVICCSSLPAVRSIIKYGVWRLGFNWWLPNLTSEMYARLTSKGEHRSVTFSTLQADKSMTVTVSARLLNSTDMFKKLENASDHHQTAGFFTGADSIMPSFGVSRRYARVWTPYKLNK